MQKICLLSNELNLIAENPSNEFHVKAMYVNSTAVQAEIFRVSSGVRETDVLATARLNTSHLLHSRLHWRPEMFDNLEVSTLMQFRI